MVKDYPINSIEVARLRDENYTLEQQNADLVAALYAAKFWMEGQHSTVFGDCGVCGSESPYHHGKCPKAQVDQALTDK